MADMEQGGIEDILGEIPKGKDGKNKIVIRRNYFKEREYIDIREYFVTEGGQWLPTKKGISMPIERLDELLEMLDRGKSA